MLGLSNCKSHASLTLFIRYHELTNENVSYSLVNQSKTKIFTNQKITKNLQNKSTMVCLLFSNLLERQKREDNEIPSHLIHEIKTKGYDVIGVQAFLGKKE